jgi:hypothetical protein
MKTLTNLNYLDLKNYSVFEVVHTRKKKSEKTENRKRNDGQSPIPSHTGSSLSTSKPPPLSHNVATATPPCR